MGARCSEKVDIFSLGVVLWELVTGVQSAWLQRASPLSVLPFCCSASGLHLRHAHQTCTCTASAK